MHDALSLDVDRRMAQLPRWKFHRYEHRSAPVKSRQITLVMSRATFHVPKMHLHSAEQLVVVRRGTRYARVKTHKSPGFSLAGNPSATGIKLGRTCRSFTTIIQNNFRLHLRTIGQPVTRPGTSTPGHAGQTPRESAARTSPGLRTEAVHRWWPWESKSTTESADADGFPMSRVATRRGAIPSQRLRFRHGSSSSSSSVPAETAALFRSIPSTLHFIWTPAAEQRYTGGGDDVDGPLR
jgi:hypothetical protein